MPELPEVETFTRYFNEAALHQKIIDVDVSDDKILRNISSKEFIKICRGRTFVASRRVGKYLFGQMDKGGWIQFHFGMTGDFLLYGSDEAPPKYERFHFLLEDGMKLGFDCPRKFARIVHTGSLDVYIEEKNLGKDALEVTEEEFLSFTEGRSGTLKGFLLNQKWIAGIGNLYADEMCYQCLVHPASVTGKIPKRKRKQLHRSMLDILQTAIKRTAYYKEYPEGWFWEWRDVDKKGPKGYGKIAVDKIGGRTTYFFPKVQKLYT